MDKRISNAGGLYPSEGIREIRAGNNTELPFKRRSNAKDYQRMLMFLIRV